MNNTFSFKRFGYLLREILVERKIFFLGLAIALVLYQSFVSKSLESFRVIIDYAGFRGFLAFSGSIVSTIILVASLGKRYQASANGLRTFMLPASDFEKWFSTFCVILIFLLIHGILFKVVDVALISALKTEIMAMGVSDAEKTKLLNEAYPYSLTGDISKANAITTSLLAAVLLVGTTYFKKNQIVLTLISVVGIIVLLFLLNWGVGHLIFGETATIEKLVPFTSANFSFQPKGSDLLNQIELQHSSVSSTMVNVAYPVLAVIFFIVYYFRLKETEI